MQLCGLFDREPSLQDERGYTLIELIVVLCLVGLLLLFAPPRFDSWQNRLRLEGEAEKIAAFLNYARLRSLKKGERTGVYFDISADEYRLIVLPDNWEEMKIEDLTIESCSLEQGVRIAGETFSPWSSVAAFGSGEAPASTGTLTLVEETGRTAAVRLVPVSGEIRIEY